MGDTFVGLQQGYSWIVLEPGQTGSEGKGGVELHLPESRAVRGEVYSFGSALHSWESGPGFAVSAEP
ncbi:unnamed protein product [Pleuronectes platessa]|uniref:Uncharacterized protein n=1 Tax=Pleuronectes platessa TaxID=8262 RepID=A0A9N7TRH0_PLEPL|nr:unnamed protein product [Pleuronectes platessa]